MKLEQIYELVVKKGLEKDPRTKKELKDHYANVHKAYKKLKGVDRKYFDKLNLTQPFADTRILYGDKKKNVKTIMAGIDIDGSEILTAYLLNEKGAGIDLVMAHHPSGKALAGLHHVMHVQTNILHKLGVKEDVAKSFMKERIEEVFRAILSKNHEKAVDNARLLDIPFMCVHTPADNHVNYFLAKLFERKKPKKVSDVLRLLKTIPEYQKAMETGTGPCLIAGKENNNAGKIFVDMTGGTEGSKKIFARVSQAGVGTMVCMHLSEEHLKIAKDEFVNVVIAGHIASDNLGLNLVLDELVKVSDLNIIPCSGFVRIER